VIVTRRRRKPFPYHLVILALLVAGGIAFVFAWPPARTAIVTGPWSAPLRIESLNQTIVARDRQIAQLQRALSDAQNATQDKQKRVALLEEQIAQLEMQGASSRAPSATRARRSRTATSAFAATDQPSNDAGGTDVAEPGTDEMRRTAQYWASMDPENAAKVVQRLTPDYVVRVFALMQPDVVGAILDAVPVAYAARVTEERPDLAR
jgi:flagellar motility protein MotE (MotC chaperone)